MTPCDSPDPRTITNAVAKGYAPPLAWDDIDDPDEQPHLGRTRRPVNADRLEDYDHLTSSGESHEQALKRLGWSEEAFDRAIHREQKKVA